MAVAQYEPILSIQVNGTKPVFTAVVSDDEEFIVTGSELAEVWDAETGQLLASFKGHRLTEQSFEGIVRSQSQS